MCHHIVFIAGDESRCSSLFDALERKDFVCSTMPPDEIDWQGSPLRNGVDLVVADASAPSAELAAYARDVSAACEAPIIVLYDPEHDAPERQAECIEDGAADCVPVDVDPCLFAARVKARLRPDELNGRGEERRYIRCGHLQIDTRARVVTLAGDGVNLRPKEFDLLVALAEQEGVPVPSEELLRRVWGYNGDIRTRTLDVHVCRLRRELETDASEPRIIITEPRVGYKLCAPL